MILVNVNKVDGKEVMMGSIKAVAFNIPFDSKIYNKLIDLSDKAQTVTTVVEYNAIMEEATELLEDNRMSEFETVCPDLVVRKGKFYLKTSTEESDVDIPEGLANKIIESVSKGVDPKPLIKAWVLFLQNRNLNATKAKLFSDYVTSTVVDDDRYEELLEEGFKESIAKEMATFNEVSISQEGLIVFLKYVNLIDTRYEVNEDNEIIEVEAFKTTKKVDRITGDYTEEKDIPEFVDDDEMLFEPSIMRKSGDAFFCDDELGHIVKVGKIHQLPSWNHVDCRDYESAVKGLHLGGRTYVKNFGGRTSYLLECLVSPADIGAFTNSGDCAVRVRRYFVYGAAGKPTKNLYHSSAYAKILDEEWEEMKAEAIANSKKLLANIISK